MKKLLLPYCLLLIAILSLPRDSFSQNIGIGTNEPLNRLQVAGSFLVNTPTIVSSSAPTPAQTITLVNGFNPIFGDSVGRIFDTGGPAGNYAANINSTIIIAQLINCIATEFTVESINLGLGDSLIVKESQLSTDYLFAAGNGYSTPVKKIFNSTSIYILFKSNADANTGAGFSILIRRLYDNSSSLPDISGNAGHGMFFDAKTGSFRSGLTINTALGYQSVAMGGYNIASGTWSTALGGNCTASGSGSSAIGSYAKATEDYSTAIGTSSTASGDHSMVLGSSSVASGPYSLALGYSSQSTGSNSIAMGNAQSTGAGSFAAGEFSHATGDYSYCLGYNSTASGDYSTAMGQTTLASGINSTALGISTFASGLRSTAMGYNASTNNQTNSFCIGGSSTATTCTSPNQFMARFDNYTFWISASNYAYLLPASNGWAYTSDRNKKERFEELDGESVLKKLSNIPFCSWNFKAADTRQYRHYGIAAQDFYTAFGRDSYGSIGNDTTVSPLDLLGVAYSAIKALEKRTTDQQEQNKHVIQENDQLRADNLALQRRLNSLEAKLNDLVAIKEKEEATKNGIAINKQ